MPYTEEYISTKRYMFPHIHGPVRGLKTVCIVLWLPRCPYHRTPQRILLVLADTSSSRGI